MAPFSRCRTMRGTGARPRVLSPGDRGRRGRRPSDVMGGRHHREEARPRPDVEHDLASKVVGPFRWGGEVEGARALAGGHGIPLSGATSAFVVALGAQSPGAWVSTAPARKPLSPKASVSAPPPRRAGARLCRAWRDGPEGAVGVGGGDAAALPDVVRVERRAWGLSRPAAAGTRLAAGR